MEKKWLIALRAICFVGQFQKICPYFTNAIILHALIHLICFLELNLTTSGIWLEREDFVEVLKEKHIVEMAI